MEARPVRSRRLGRLLAFLAIAVVTHAGGESTQAASSRTRNFIVTAATPQMAAEIAEAAETYRRSLAIEWLGQPLADWQQPCPIVAHLANGAGGRTSFMFNGTQPFGWDMEVFGPHERILDSVLPHEITHTIFATHFGRPLPRWADEGACTTVEHHSERSKHEGWLIQFLRTEKGIPFNQMFAMTEYPTDILPLYSQGYSVARYLIAQGGKPKFMAFVGQGLQTGNWTDAVRTHYGYDSLGTLQLEWVDWVAKGSREDSIARRDEVAGIRLAAAEQPAELDTETTTVAELRRGRRPQVDPNLLANDESFDQPSGPERVAAGKSWYARREPTEQAADMKGRAATARRESGANRDVVRSQSNRRLGDSGGWRSRGAGPDDPRVARSLHGE